MKLGDKMKDKVSGFEGVAIAKTEWLYGCVRVVLQPMADKDGKLPDTQAFDIDQLESQGSKIERTPSATGGPMPIPTRQKESGR